MRLLAAAVALLWALPALAADLPKSCSSDDPIPPRPSWCQPGFACVPTAEMARLGTCISDLKIALGTPPSKWGFCAGPSLGLVGESTLDAEGNRSFEWHAGAGASVLWGFRF